MQLIRAEPGRTPWVKAQPPGAPRRTPPPGLAPGWGPGDPSLGEGHRVLVFALSIAVG